jgi:NAD dependent epimerase/dehydratase family enzyme
MKVVPGGMAEEMPLASQRMMPRRLLDSGYQFRHPTLRGALTALLK